MRRKFTREERRAICVRAGLASAKLFTTEFHRAGGRASAAKKDPNFINLIRELPQAKKAQSKTGRILGRRNVESGFLKTLRTPEHQRDANRAANHTRWHLARNRVSVRCDLCIQDNLIFAFA
jgi:hypothetical protein